ncbi:hypothetical protein ACHHYP_13576 [Achlya hypogyna]|uniref:Uncharacterized protein n=1 Tax=Achlya hypogyna TaxID=1202772 RepID=A0A1V9YEU9_ACHHY|nr:hypothetical protein ACHHYP_13576 [Achlya hypogyna]
MSTKRAAPTTPAAPAAEAAPVAAPADNDLLTLNFDAGSDEEEEEEDEEDEEERATKRRRTSGEAGRNVKVVFDPTAKKLESIEVAIMKATGNSPRGGFSMMSTSSSGPIMNVIKKELAVARKLLKENKFPEALGVLVATFMNMDQFNNWFADTEEPEKVEAIFKAYYKLITDVLKKDDATLRLTGRGILVEELTRFGKDPKDAFGYEFKWFE